MEDKELITNATQLLSELKKSFQSCKQGRADDIRLQDLLNKVSLLDRLSCSCLPYLRVLVSLSYTFKEILSTENWKFYALKSENRSIKS